MQELFHPPIIISLLLTNIQIMGRGGRGGGGGRSSSSSRGRSSSPPSRSSQAATKPMPAQTKPQEQPKTGGGMFSGIGSMLMTGMAFGTGS